MVLLASPFILQAIMLAFGCNPYAAVGVACFIMLAVISGLTSSGGVIGEE